MSQSKFTTIIVTDEDTTTTMESPEALTSSGHRNGMNAKVKNLMNIFSSSQSHLTKKRLRKRTEISDFDSMGDDDAADYALMQEEEKLMLKEEHAANRRIQSNHDENQTSSITIAQSKVADEKKESSYLPSLNHAIASIEGKKETKQIHIIKKDTADGNGAGVWLGTRGRKSIGEPLPPPPTILVKIPEIANPIIGGTSTCSLQGLEFNGSSTTINTIFSFKPGLLNTESVPNPILSSPFQPKVHIDFNQQNEGAGNSHHTTDVSAIPLEQAIKQESPSTINESLVLLDESKPIHMDRKGTNTRRKRSVSFSITESRESKDMKQSGLNSALSPSTRKRIHSIDINSSYDIVELEINTTSIVPTSNACEFSQGCLAHTQSKTKEETELIPGVSRDRCLSFELFSFGLNEFDAAPLYTTFDETNINVNGRPRGDSIIFDPISFIDGGIHEQNALKRARRTSISSDVDEIEIMNTPGFLEAPISDCIITSINMNQLVIPEALNEDMNGHYKNRKFKVESGVRSRTSKSNFEVHHSSSKRKERSCDLKEDRRKFKRTTHSPTTSSNISFSPSLSIPLLSLSSASEVEETIQMPQGSLAAAAAAMSFYPHLLPVSVNGSVSHTSFPMSLLNKDGRIGIYLPEARKDRIAQFHSKRQKRTWRKRIKYDCRKKLADSRPRVKGRFVKSLDDGE